MYRVIVVEDEKIVRDGLSGLIAEEDLGFEVAGSFVNGLQAYEWLQTNHCDVVLTDIVMSQMDGLELARKISMENSGIKIIILSGYADFEKARKAIQYGVVDFLQKPVDEDELLDLFRSLKEQLDKESDIHKVSKELESWCQLLILEIDTGNHASIEKTLRNFMDSIAYLPLKSMQSMLEQLCSEIAMEYRRRGIDVWSITKEIYNIRQVYKQQSYEMLYSCVLEMFLALVNGLTASAAGDTNNYGIERIKRYIQNHIGEDLGIDEIARAHKMHPSYMSRIFRQQTGMTVLKYITKVRMERACELLRQGKYSVSEISCMLGYNVSYYFSVVFKKYTGYTPTEYYEKIVKS